MSGKAAFSVSAVSGFVEEFAKEAAEAALREMENAATELVADLKKRSPRRTGKYAENWDQKKEYKKGTRKIVVYNKAPTYREAHLNEKGAIRGKRGVMPARPHISPAFEEARIKLESKY